MPKTAPETKLQSVRTMNRNKLSLASVAAISLGFAASAVPINITVDSAGNLLNTIGIADATQYGQQSNNSDDNLAFLKIEIGNWNGVPLSPVLPAAGTLALERALLDRRHRSLASE